MALSRLKKVSNFAIYSRIMVLCMQVLFNYLMPDHDAKVFNPPTVHRKKIGDIFVTFLFEGFRRWDGVYFIHIAEYGYTYENTAAFFPLYPMIIKIIANTVMFPLHYLANYTSVLLLSGYLVNLWCFVQAAKVLYKLTEKVLDDETLAYKSVQLFAINPASIFFSAYYSEAMFALLCFKGMLHIEENRTINGGIFFGISTLCRSNGLVNIGFILYRKLNEGIVMIRSLWNTRYIDMKTASISVISSLILFTIPVVSAVLLSISPFVLYQYYIFRVFCDTSATYKNLPTHILNYGNDQGYKMPHTGPSKWCFDTIPNSYSYIQKEHWNQGFLQYYQLKQIPNFLLATPIVLLGLVASISYFSKNVIFCITLGMKDNFNKDTTDKKTDLPTQQNQNFYSKSVFVYIVHLLFLLIFGMLFMHVQVLTRFICSASPVIYWYVAYRTTPPEKLGPKQHNPYDVFHQNMGEANKSIPISRQNSTKSVDEMLDWENQGLLDKAILVYFHMYFFVGIAAFANFLPWT